MSCSVTAEYMVGWIIVGAHTIIVLAQDPGTVNLFPLEKSAAKDVIID
jgi:hypothetical protein